MGALWRQLTRLDETVFAGAGAGLETGGSAERGHEFRHPEAVGAAETGFVETIGDVLLVRGEQELFNRTANLFKRAGEVACTANDLYTWASARRRLEIAPDHAEGKRIRKIYRPGVLLDPSASAHVREIQRTGAGIRITSDELNETIILDRRIAIMAGDNTSGMRSYSVITRPDLVRRPSPSARAAVWSLQPDASKSRICGASRRVSSSQRVEEGKLGRRPPGRLEQRRHSLIQQVAATPITGAGP
jgi:hypothetical protein